jgi:hypothetical protein
LKGTESQGKREAGSQSLSDNQETLRSLECQVQNADYQEVAEALLDRYKETLEETALESLERTVAKKPKFAYWTLSSMEYDLEYSLAMDLGQLQVFKGNVSSDRVQYRLARRLNRAHPTLVGLNLYDYRRQFIVYLSPRAVAFRRFALVEMARQESPERTIHL